MTGLPLPPPANLDAEAVVLSAALLSREALDSIQGILAPKHFYADANRRVYEAIVELNGEGHPVDTVTVATHLRDRGRLEQVGGTPYLAQIVDSTPAVAHVVDHARLVLEKYESRRTIEGLRLVEERLRRGEGVDEVRPALSSLAAGIAPRGPTGATIGSVLDGWRDEGELIHEPTGFAELDRLTGGGPVYGSRWFLAGAPDAGKTALQMQLAHVWARRGVHVGILAVDEEPSDLVTRFAQRVGYSRVDTERRDRDTLDGVARELADLPLWFFDGSSTIEDAARTLRTKAGTGRAALLVDSIQTVQCDVERFAHREFSDVAAVTSRVRALRQVATECRLIALATSELGRAAYSSDEARRTTSTLAAGKWSGAIEYSARVLLGLRSVAGEKDLIEIEIAKNKHGPRDEKVHLRIDRATQSLWQVEFEPPPDRDSEDVRAERTLERTKVDAELVSQLIRSQPGITVRGLWGAAAAAGGLSRTRTSAALAALGDRVERGTGPRGATPLYMRDGASDPD